MIHSCNQSTQPSFKGLIIFNKEAMARIIEPDRIILRNLIAQAEHDGESGTLGTTDYVLLFQQGKSAVEKLFVHCLKTFLNLKEGERKDFRCVKETFAKIPEAANRVSVKR